MAFISVAQAQEQLNIASGHEAALAVFVDAACDLVEQWCGAIDPRSVTESVTASGGCAVLSNHPASLPAGSPYTLDQQVWAVRGVVGTEDVTYTAGYVVTPGWATMAALIIVEHLWRTRRGAGARNSVDMAPGAGFLVPNQAAALMEPHRKPSLA